MDPEIEDRWDLNYQRVLPRDLFNEANLLKCHGRLLIELENHSHQCQFLEERVLGFEIAQDGGSGDLVIWNLTFLIRKVRHWLVRPLNARDDWPLWVERLDDQNFDAVRVFDEHGKLSPEFLKLIA